jgi:hypothetical protein
MFHGFVQFQQDTWGEAVMVTKVIFGQSKDMMRNINGKALFIGLMVFCAVILSSESNAQCELQVESKVEKLSSGANSNILLRVVKGTGSIEFYLIDLKAPHDGPVMKESVSAATLKDDYVIVFNNVKPSAYTIQAIQNRDCQVSVGGVEGITVSAN